MRGKGTETVRVPKRRVRERGEEGRGGDREPQRERQLARERGNKRGSEHQGLGNGASERASEAAGKGAGKETNKRGRQSERKREKGSSEQVYDREQQKWIERVCKREKVWLFVRCVCESFPVGCGVFVSVQLYVC